MSVRIGSKVCIKNVNLNNSSFIICTICTDRELDVNNSHTYYSIVDRYTNDKNI